MNSTSQFRSLQCSDALFPWEYSLLTSKSFPLTCLPLSSNIHSSANAQQQLLISPRFCDPYPLPHRSLGGTMGTSDRHHHRILSSGSPSPTQRQSFPQSFQHPQAASSHKGSPVLSPTSPRTARLLQHGSGLAASPRLFSNDSALSTANGSPASPNGVLGSLSHKSSDFVDRVIHRFASPAGMHRGGHGLLAPFLQRIPEFSAAKNPHQVNFSQSQDTIIKQYSGSLNRSHRSDVMLMARGASGSMLGNWNTMNSFDSAQSASPHDRLQGKHAAALLGSPRLTPSKPQASQFYSDPDRNSSATRYVKYLAAPLPFESAQNNKATGPQEQQQSQQQGGVNSDNLSDVVAFRSPSFYKIGSAFRQGNGNATNAGRSDPADCIQVSSDHASSMSDPAERWKERDAASGAPHVNTDQHASSTLALDKARCWGTPSNERQNGNVASSAKPIGHQGRLSKAETDRYSVFQSEQARTCRREQPESIDQGLYKPSVASEGKPQLAAGDFTTGRHEEGSNGRRQAFIEGKSTSSQANGHCSKVSSLNSSYRRGTKAAFRSVTRPANLSQQQSSYSPSDWVS